MKLWLIVKKLQWFFGISVVLDSCLSTEILPSPVLETFTSESIDSSFSRVIIYNDSVIIGGKNEIYKLNSNLNKLQKWTGQKCPVDSVEEENEIRVLLVYNIKIPLLVNCGTACRGMCKIHLLEKIYQARTIGNINNSVNYVASHDTTVAFFAPGPFNSPPVLYSASTYDHKELKLSPPSVSSKLLNISNPNVAFEYTYRTETSFTSVNFHSMYKKRFIVKYLYGFSYGGYSYFLTRQRVSLDSQNYETRIARVCQKDTKFFSYTEVPLKCQRGLDYYNVATSAYLGKVGFSLKNVMHLEQREDILYVAFVTTIPQHGEMFDRTKGSIICSFPMSQIIGFFTNTTKECFRAEPRTRLLQVITGIEQACIKREDYIDDTFCGSSFNHYIEAVESMPGGFRSHVDKIVSSIAITLQNGETIAVLGTDDGYIIKIVLGRRQDQPLYAIKIADDDQKDKEIKSSNAFDKNHSNIYFIAGNKLVKFPIGSCSVYMRCDSCLRVQDPLTCGWCGTSCAHYEECETPRSFNRSYCPPIIYKVSPLLGPTQGGTLITIEGDNFSSSQSDPNSFISILVANTECKIFHWNNTRLQCTTGSVKSIKEGKIFLTVNDLSWHIGTYDIAGNTTSKDTFHYVYPELFYINPSFGPVSGGTNVTLKGQMLHVGYSRKVLLNHVECFIYSVTEDEIKCTSGKSSYSNNLGVSQLIIDNAKLEAKRYFDEESQIVHGGKTFEYLEDPVILNVTPHVATVSGGTNITVTGRNLHSIAYPHMIVIVISPITGKQMEFIQDCFINRQTGKHMVCPIPPLKDPSLRSQAQSIAPVLTHMAFIMDGVSYLRELRHNNPELSRLRYFPDPIYYKFEELNQIRKIPHEVSLLDIKGENLNLAHERKDIKVIIGKSSYCNVTTITFDTLWCIIPPIQTDSNDTRTSVEVIAGDMKFNLGYIQFVDTMKENTNRLLAIVIPVVLFIILSIILITIFIRRRLSRKGFHSEMMVAYTAEPNNREGSCRRRQGTNDYLDMRGRNNSNGEPVVVANTSLTHQVKDETVHLLHAENIYVIRDYLTLGNVIGQGHFGRVYKGQLHLPGKEESIDVAVKTLHNSAMTGENDVDSFLQEGLMMKDFHHHNVLTLIGVCFEADGSPMVIIPYMKFGDLQSYIRNENHSPTVKDLLQYGVQIASGMKYLSELKFVHRDLAARNCMLDEDHTVKVADFGLSRDIYERDYYSSDNKKTKLPVKWMAPESLEKGTYNTKTDVWSFGVVLWELMTRGVTPYPDVDNWDILQYLKNGRRMPQPSYCPDLLYNIMLRCWLEDPKKRLAFSELEEEVQSVITKLEQKSKQRRVDLNVTYVNYPSEMANFETENIL